MFVFMPKDSFRQSEKKMKINICERFKYRDLKRSKY